MALEKADVARARVLYNNFFSRYGQPNPSDINTLEKFNYANEIGFDALALMQKARKESHDFTLLRVFRAAEGKPTREANLATAGSVSQFDSSSWVAGGN